MVEMRATYANYRIGKGEVMRNLNPHGSSFLYSPIYGAEPYASWIALARTERELDYLQELFRVVPKGWIEWVNRRVEKKIAAGTGVRNMLDYKLSVLTHGMISLQETKYICDILENALRQVVINHALKTGIRYCHLSPYVPMFGETFARYVQGRGETSEDAVVTPEFIMSLSFYQLVETISRKWKTLLHEPYIRGFGQYFANHKACRDYRMFRREMTVVRSNRNVIAHTQNLMSDEQTRQVFELSRKWLAPLEIDLYDKVALYREHRPEFLKEIKLLKQIRRHAENR